MSHLDKPEPTERLPKPPAKENPLAPHGDAEANAEETSPGPATVIAPETGADSAPSRTGDSAAAAGDQPSDKRDREPVVLQAEQAQTDAAEAVTPAKEIVTPSEMTSGEEESDAPELRLEDAAAPASPSRPSIPRLNPDEEVTLLKKTHPIRSAPEPPSADVMETSLEQAALRGDIIAEREPAVEAAGIAAAEAEVPAPFDEAATKKALYNEETKEAPFQPAEEERQEAKAAEPIVTNSVTSNGLLSDGWKAVGESVRGTSHEKTGAGCQDAHLLTLLEDQTLIAAISDGAGSAAQAELGSATAVRSALEDLKIFSTRMPWPEEDEDWQKLMHVVLRRAKQAVEKEAEDCGAKPRDLASTLLVMVAMPNLVAAAQIGDGAIVVGDGDGSVTALTKPQSGEYLNETVFLISPKALDQAQTCIWRGQVTHLAAFSDGLQMLAMKMDEGTPHPPFFTPLFRFISGMTDVEEAQSQLNAFLRSPRITQRADDDLTLLLAHWPHSAS